MLLYFLSAFEDVEAHLENLWLMMAIASRYGHQPLSEIGRLTVEDLGRFNHALSTLIERETKSGRSLPERMSGGWG